ncbi:hypothetical protein SLEP1_g60005 [Rubroshorea leprosula]|uniref:Uncharacterized protein n=1 Tax=Rubroshorea leprosula TaxID=152421 RepID=A0AAV5MV82_9ROSI|nr:hypothetical protein SLEP1_g60005 [Rubroshorea leprosula]
MKFLVYPDFGLEKETEISWIIPILRFRVIQARSLLSLRTSGTGFQVTSMNPLYWIPTMILGTMFQEIAKATKMGL